MKNRQDMYVCIYVGGYEKCIQIIVLVGKPEKRPLGRPMRGWEIVLYWVLETYSVMLWTGCFRFCVHSYLI
jgi:hypothetical protein